MSDKCKWTAWDHSFFTSDCGMKWLHDVDTEHPKEFIKYCPKCGKIAEIETYTEDEDVKEYWSQCDDERKRQVQRAETAEAWIEKIIDKFEYYEIGTPEEVSLLRFCRFAVELKKLIDEAPI